MSTASRTALTGFRADNFHAMGASVLIVDDHPGFPAQARPMLKSEGYRGVGEAGGASGTVEERIRCG